MRLPNLLQVVLPEDWEKGGFGLYVHWPFCQSKCPYCDFNSHVVGFVDQARWRAAYVSEIERVGAETEGRLLRSIYFGGGTPSLMEAETVEAILEAARKSWRFANDIEITLEANPNSVEAGRFAGYRAAGVNRVSLGVQALNDADLKGLGRLHSVDEALRALDLACNTFDRVSFDLIYARQNQTLTDWEAELKQALSFGTGHMSLYQLSVEDGTAFGDRFAKGGLRGLPSEGLAADLFEATQAMCETAGIPAYEVSNHAKQGQKSRHNMIYWQAGDYAGIGPGAHGRLTLGGTRYATVSSADLPTLWLKSVEEAENGEGPREKISDEDALIEGAMMGLRLWDGIDLDRWVELKNDNYNNNINELVDINMLKLKSGILCVTPKGRPLLNSVLASLLAN